MSDNDFNEKRAKNSVKMYGFQFDKLPHDEIRQLLRDEIENYTPGSSEYLRVLCGYLFCIGDPADAALISKAKYEINFDVGCMIDLDWIDGLNSTKNVGKRDALVNNFVAYYRRYFNL